MVEVKFYQMNNNEMQQQPESLQSESTEGDLEKESNNKASGMFNKAYLQLKKLLEPNMLFSFAATGIFVFVSIKDDATNMYCNMNPYDN